MEPAVPVGSGTGGPEHGRAGPRCGPVQSRDELRYSMRSVWANCGWARRIFVVTAGHTPSCWLTNHPDVQVIDHSAILPADALPTFNSHAIEASLHRIPGLSEHFVYFNDDMLVGRPLRPEVFFTANGLARVFQGGARIPAEEDGDTLAVDTAAMQRPRDSPERIWPAPARQAVPLPLSTASQRDGGDRGEVP